MENRESQPIKDRDSMDLGLGKTNPQTHDTPGLNEPGAETPEITPVQPVRKDEEPIKFGKQEGEKDVNRAEETSNGQYDDNQATRQYSNRGASINPDNEPSQEGGK